MTTTIYPGFRANEPTAIGRSIVTAVDAEAVRAAAVTYSKDEVDGLIDGAGGGSATKIVAGVIRPDASGVWSLLDDGETGHVPLRVDSVTQDNGGGKSITIDYTSHGFTKLHSFIVTGDEQLSGYFNIGGSVGVTQAVMQLHAVKGVQGRVYRAGGSWSIETTLVDGTYDYTSEKQWKLKVPFWCDTGGGSVTPWYGSSTGYHGKVPVIKNTSNTVDANKQRTFDFRWMDPATGGIADSNVDGFYAHFSVPPQSGPLVPSYFCSGVNDPPTTWNSINLWFIGVFE